MCFDLKHHTVVHENVLYSIAYSTVMCDSENTPFSGESVSESAVPVVIHEATEHKEGIRLD